MVDYRVPEMSTFTWQLPVIDKDLTAPPGGESKGDRYIVGPSATGAWAGEDDNIATYDGSGWIFDIAVEGFQTWVEDEDKFYKFNGTAWDTSADIDDLDDVPDGTTYGRVKNSELTTGFVSQLNDGTNVVTAAEAKEAYDRRATYDSAYKALVFSIT